MRQSKDRSSSSVLVFCKKEPAARVHYQPAEVFNRQTGVLSNRGEQFLPFIERYSLFHPEKIEKTICIGQVANFVPAEEEGYKHARSEALKAGDDVTALDAAFEAFQADPGCSIAELRSLTAPYNTPDVPQRAFIEDSERQAYEKACLLIF